MKMKQISDFTVQNFLSMDYKFVDSHGTVYEPIKNIERDTQANKKCSFGLYFVLSRGHINMKKRILDIEIKYFN